MYMYLPNIRNTNTDTHPPKIAKFARTLIAPRYRTLRIKEKNTNTNNGHATKIFKSGAVLIYSNIGIKGVAVVVVVILEAAVVILAIAVVVILAIVAVVILAIAGVVKLPIVTVIAVGKDGEVLDKSPDRSKIFISLLFLLSSSDILYTLSQCLLSLPYDT